jgi:hypothetical protein
MAKRLGAKIVQVSPGYLSTVQARAREYGREVAARLAPFGVDTPEAIEAIAAAATGAVVFLNPSIRIVLPLRSLWIAHRFGKPPS